MFALAWLHSRAAYFWPLAWIAAALVCGLLVDRWVLRRAARSAVAARHRWIAVGIEALRGGVLFWFVIAGIHAAMATSALDRNVVRILDDVLGVLGFGSVTWVAARFAGGMIHLNAERLGARVLSPSLLATIAQSIIIVIGGLVILQAMGVAIAPLLTALGVGGLAVALALQPTLANLFAGVQLVASGALRPGDYISVSGFDGYVEDVTWRTTTIRNVTGDAVIIPNLTISTTPFVNYRVGSRIVSLELAFTVKAGSNPDEAARAAEQAGREALRSLGAASDERASRVRFEQLADGNIQAHLVLRLPVSVDAERARNETIKRLFLALQQKD
jgi:small-conductance mechanosensitive channel